MQVDYEFYGGTPPHQKIETSLAAAEAIRPKAGSKRLAVLNFLEFRGPVGATDEEIAIVLGTDRSSTVPRRRELVMGGWVVDSGSTRLTRCKRRSIVWVARGVPVEPQPKKKSNRQVIKELNEEVEALKKQLSHTRGNQCQFKKS
jgi:hypothetical protein